MTEFVTVDRADGVLTLTLNRPEKKNALTSEMYAVMNDGLVAADSDPEIRCVLIQAAGDAFTAGSDISEFAAYSAGGERVGAGPLLDTLARTRVPIVAAVHGRAVGIGLTLLLHCDLVYIAEEAQLSAPFVNLALVPEAASSLLLPARIGHARAFGVFVLGETISGRDAVSLGIANAALPAAEVQARARAAAVAVASRAPAAVAATKGLMRDAEGMTTRIGEELTHFARQLRSPEAAEAFAAFAQRRAPNFTTGGG
ncbi:enoyl-CoA hydratase-related protein [Phenylobacterium sp.]|jgi:enoyl-CoA hydratase/carnithine racemase|uniref:enoyl-CoA hydratase-related protein n=1 Tax=Phenylobacterium sp. TaxID=1871053 RepID=UPI003783601A